MPAAPGKALPFGYSVCCECSHRSFLVRRAPDERTDGRVYTPETRICQLNSPVETITADARLIPKWSTTGLPGVKRAAFGSSERRAEWLK
jgi:hypothetical protein